MRARKLLKQGCGVFLTSICAQRGFRYAELRPARLLRARAGQREPQKVLLLICEGRKLAARVYLA